jgi:hypothetical protein
VILIELTAAVDAAGTLRTFYVSTDRFTTEPNDSPADTSFLPCVADPGSIGLHAFSDGRTTGRTKLEVGEITLINVDGQLDDWLRYSFDGRPLTIRSGVAGPYPSAFKTVLVATVDGVDTTWDKVVIRIKDKQFLFDKPVLTALYGGGNVLPNGLDGAADLKSKAKPRAAGVVFNVSPPMVNTSRLIFEVGACNSVDHVYSNGAELTAGAVYTSQADMEANSPASGYFRAWPAGGYFRIGSYDAQQITADVTQGATTAQRTVGQVLAMLAVAAGIPTADIVMNDVSALDALNASPVGIWLDDDSTTFASAMDQVAASIGAWYGFDGSGMLRMGQLTEPVGPPKAILAEYDILDGIERRAPADNGMPAWSVTVNHTRNYTVQTSGLAGSAAVARQPFVSEETRAANAVAPTVKTQWLLASTITVDTLLTKPAAADAEAARLLALYKVRRDIFEIPVALSVLTATGIWLLDVIGVDHPRFQLNTGPLFRVIGVALENGSNKAILTIWG